MFIAEVDISSFVAFPLCIYFSDGSIELRGLKLKEKNSDSSTSAMISPMKEIRDKFRIDYRIVQTSEWLALSFIPPELIRFIYV